MAVKDKCPECGSEDLKIWAIKNNRMARCNGCKRTVRLGKSGEQQSEETAGGKGKPAAKSQTPAPAHRSGKKRAAKRGAGKAGGVPERTVSPKPADSAGGFLKRLWNTDVF